MICADRCDQAERSSHRSEYSSKGFLRAVSRQNVIQPIAASLANRIRYRLSPNGRIIRHVREEVAPLPLGWIGVNTQTMHRNQGQIEGVELCKQAKQGGLVDKRSTQGCQPVNVVLDDDSLKSVGPIPRQVSLNANRVVVV